MPKRKRRTSTKSAREYAATKHTVPLRRVPAKTLFLALHIGDGETDDGTKFNVTSIMGSGSLVVGFDVPRPDGEIGPRYIVTLDSVVRAAIDALSDDFPHQRPSTKEDR